MGKELGFGIWGLGFRVWDLGFGAWDLGFRVWDWGFEMGITVASVRSVRVYCTDELTFFPMAPQCRCMKFTKQE